jgi:hypothetical protein
LLHPTLEILQRRRLRGMLKALQEQLQMPEIESLSFEERLGLLLEREVSERETRSLNTRLKQAKLRAHAAIEDIDYRTHRGLDKALMTRLAACQWIGEHLNVLITGPTGVGKTWIACALAHKACREGFSARYLRLPRLLQELSLARADGRGLIVTPATPPYEAAGEFGNQLISKARHSKNPYSPRGFGRAYDRGPTGVTRSSSASWPKPICSSSMIGA